WLEREGDDAELMSLLGGRGINLRLHARWFDALHDDREYAAAEREHRAVLDETQQLYRLRLDSAMRSTYDVMQRADVNPRTHGPALEDALAVVRFIDARHVERVREMRVAFEQAWRPSERAVLARHIDDVAAVLAQSSCLV